MKLLSCLLAGLFLLVLGNVTYAQSPTSTNPLVGEWEFVVHTVVVGDKSLTRALVGSIDIGQKTFSGQWGDEHADDPSEMQGTSGTYTLDETKSLATIIDNMTGERAVFKYILFQKDDDNYLELEFLLANTVTQEDLDRMSPWEKRTFEEMSKIKFGLLLKRK